jgi:ubiquinol-cytochrome c reductase cytochrome b subunit
MYKGWLAAFVVSFVILGWLGMEPPSALYTLIARICTAIYFAFFLFMPFFTRMDRTKPVPDRVTS